VKARVAHCIEERHRREREPHLLRLAELHQHRMATVVSIAAIEGAIGDSAAITRGGRSQ
jgi:hypothetical protein